MILRLLNLKVVWFLAALAVISVVVYQLGKDKELADLAPEDFDPTYGEVRGNLRNASLNTAQQAEKRFEIFQQAGDHAQAYIQAGLVANGYLRAGDEENHQKWNVIKERLAKKARRAKLR